MESKIIHGHKHIEYLAERYEEEEMIARSEKFFSFMNKRRTVREISNKPVPEKPANDRFVSPIWRS